MARASGGANNMQPQSFGAGGTNGKDPEKLHVACFKQGHVTLATSLRNSGLTPRTATPLSINARSSQ